MQEDAEAQDWFYADFIAGGRMDSAPTHWMPIPDPPNVSDQATASARRC
jgi:Protein of unknown function (DUF551)